MQKCDNHDEIHRSQVFKLYYSWPVLGKQHVCSYSYWSVGVTLLNEDVPGTVVDVFEAVGAQQDPAVPPRDHHQHVTHVQDLCRSQRKHISTFLRQTLTAVCRRIIMLTACCSHKRDISQLNINQQSSAQVWTIRWESILALARKPVACKQIHNFLMQNMY